MIIFCGGKQNMILLILLVDKIFLNICTVWREKKQLGYQNCFPY